MKRILAVVAIVCGTVLLSTIAYASLYRWNYQKRPPIELSDALTRAEKLLGEDAKNRYCVGAVLYGDKVQDGTRGAWNLFYAASDGSTKNVLVDMQGKVDVTFSRETYNQYFKVGARDDLDDVKFRLESTFEKHGVKTDVVLKDGVLSVNHCTRTFQVYPPAEQGGFAEDLIPLVGPMRDGVWLEVRLTDQVDRKMYGYNNVGCYWSWERGTRNTTRANVYLAVDLRYGSDLDRNLVQDLRRAFGSGTD